MAPAEQREAAVGRLLASVVALAGELGVDPEAAARVAAREQRTRTEAALAYGQGLGADPGDLDASTWASWWAAAADDGSG